MDLPSAEAALPAGPALPALRLWILRRRLRGLAHEVANLQQMLLLPGSSGAASTEHDERLARIGEALSQLSRERDDSGAPAPIGVDALVGDAERSHVDLGGEPRAAVLLAQRSGPCTLLARPDAAAAVMLVALVLAVRARPRVAAGAVEVDSQFEGDRAEITLSVDADPRRGPDAESESLFAAAAAVARGEGGSLERSRAGGRLVLQWKVPASSP